MSDKFKRIKNKWSNDSFREDSSERKWKKELKRTFRRMKQRQEEVENNFGYFN